MLNSVSRFSVDCILPPFMKTTASAKTLERAKELTSRLMFNQLKKSESPTSAISSNGQKSIKHSKKVNNNFRGSSDYSGSLNPVERLELIQQANKQPESVYNLEELYPPIKVTLSCDGDKIVKSRRGPIKFRCTVRSQNNKSTYIHCSSKFLYLIFSVPSWRDCDPGRRVLQ